jgi:hypothetical protein
MADLLSDGNLRVAWVPNISNINAPTVAELSAGILMQGVMKSDGLRTAFDSAEVDNSKLASTYDTAQVGRRSVKPGITYIRQLPRILENVLVYKATGNLVVRREVDQATNWLAGQKVEVYPVQCKAPSPSYGPNAMQMVDVDMTSTAEPAPDATVV